MTELLWCTCTFDALSGAELYEMLQLRSEVFVVEQACAFQDLDGADGVALHLLGRATPSGELLAYARCFGPGVKFAEASIGRVLTRPSARASGLGHVLMRQAKAALCAQWGPQPIRIGAQARLERFYEGHGFAVAGAPYLEDGIDHIEMLWTP